MNVVIQTVIRRHQALVKGQYILKPFFVLSLTMLYASECYSICDRIAVVSVRLC